MLFPYARAGQSRKGVYRGRLVERGRYRFGPLRASTRFPFGLFSRTITLGKPETLIVLPRLGRLTRGWAARRQEAFAGTDRRRRRPGAEGDFYGVREWRSGDGRRLIHWRSSARLGKLVVRQFERPRSRDVAVVLDLWQPEPHRPEHVENVELAVSFAATVLADVCRKGGSNIYLGISNGRAGMHRRAGLAGNAAKVDGATRAGRARAERRRFRRCSSGAIAARSPPARKSCWSARGRSIWPTRSSSRRVVRSRAARPRAAHSVRRYIERTVGGVFLTLKPNTAP